jgi:hypothetical protein
MKPHLLGEDDSRIDYLRIRFDARRQRRNG